MLKLSSERRLSFLALLLTTASLSGCGISSGLNPASSTPTQTSGSWSMKISPSTAQVLTSGTQQFSVQITSPLPYSLPAGTHISNPPTSTVTWTVNGIPGGNSAIGKIDNQGLYSAPATLPNPTSVKVTALLNSLFSSTATVALYDLTGHKVNLNWISVPSVQGYYVYRGGQTGGPYSKISALEPAASYVDNTVKSGQSYYYVVTSFTTGSGESTYSNEVEVNVPSTP